MTTHAAYMRRWREAHRAAGKCLFCKNTVRAGSLCWKCRLMNNARRREAKLRRRVMKG